MEHLGMEKKKFLFVSLAGLIGDIAWQIFKEGHEVRYYIHAEKEKDICDGFVPKTDNWEQEVDWADIIIFDDTLGQGEKAQALRLKGKPVVGGTPYTDKLEDDRSFGQRELKKAGIPIIQYGEFESFDAGIQYIQENPARYVLKPSGEAQNVKRHLFVGDEEDGSDVIRMLEAYKRALADEIKVFQLQKKINGVEVAIGAFFNGHRFIYPINLNFEHKKLFPGNIGPSTGEMGCYDEETEVLTSEGWKRFREVSREDHFASLNPETEEIVFHQPSNIVRFDHHQKMLRIKNRTTDLLVTLDHQMFGQEGMQHQKQRQWGFVPANSLPLQFVVPRSGRWMGREQESFDLPPLKLLGYQEQARLTEPVSLAMDDWLAFLGLWLSGGWTSTSSAQVGVAQANTKTAKMVSEVLGRLPFEFKRVKSGWRCDDKRLWSYLEPLGAATTRYVPEEYKQLSPRQLAILLDHMCLGEGKKQQAGLRIYKTSSARLADDAQEILLKLGRVGVVKPRFHPPASLDSRRSQEVQLSYEVTEQNEKSTAQIDRRDTETVDYQGKVYCVTVPHHTLYVRRNGKPLWCGNTSMFWSDPNRLFTQTLLKLENKLAEEGYVGYIDLNCIVNSGGIYPLEFTSRFGYPTIFIQQEGMVTPIGQFFWDLACGRDPKLKVKSGFQVGVRIVVSPYPFEDDNTFQALSKNAVIAFRKGVPEEVHIEDVKLVNGQWLVAGTSGVALVVVGLGQTMRQAQLQAYGRIKNISIPNMYYRPDIGDRWTEDSDKLHIWGYLK
jgi:phosphoribosylamine-glycine ligase